MSSLSFVALSMQTTHLDPATVSKASYLKMVDGQITRLDSIAIIPPTASSAEREVQPPEAVSWSEALSQLGMVIGKLPIVSYYRDADKEIFQAASRRSGITAPTFQWLDCRALTRELLPELPDHQPSTVLTALNLYDEHADSATVEQTAQIVLQLADIRQATTLSELWGDLYNQPDDLLGLEATLEGISSPEPAPRVDDFEDHHGATPPAAIPLSVTPVETSLEPDTPPAEDAVGPTVETAAALAEETEETPADTEPIGLEPTHPVPSPAVDPTPEYSISSPDTDEAAPDTLETAEGEEDLTADEGDSTAQSVIESENLEQPEFLKVPDTEDAISDEPSTDEPIPDDHDETDPDPVLDTPNADEGASATQSPEVAAVDESETGQKPVTAPLTSQMDQQSPAVNDETDLVAPDPEPTPDEGIADTADTSHEAEEADRQPTAPPTHASSADSKPFAPVYQVVTPAPVPRPGGRKASSLSTTQVVDPDADPETTVKTPRPSAVRTDRVWGLAGMILFGVLTVVGLVLTVMATLLFFTTNNLLVETKVAGVILTGAITLLSLLMATLSYRTYRKK